MVRGVFLFLIFSLMLSPYLFLIDELRAISLNLSEVWPAFLNTFIQSALSAMFAILAGFAAGISLCVISSRVLKKSQSFMDMYCLIPSFIPALFFVTAALQILRPFPFGLVGIIIIHTLMYVGIVALFFKSIIQSKFISITEQAYVEGASQRQLAWALFKSMKFEVSVIFLFVFVQCFTSFSVPLLVGHQTLTLETLIYEKVRTLGEVSDAIFISLIESICVIAILLIYRSPSTEFGQKKEGIQVFRSIWPIAFILLPVGLFVMGALYGSAQGITQLTQFPGGIASLMPLIIKSIAVSVFTGTFLILLLLICTYLAGARILHKFLMGYIPLSTVLVALAFGISSATETFPQELKVVLALSILFLPVLYRFEFGARIHQLRSQIESATLMGANDFLVFKKILLPQMYPTILFLAGLGAFWAIGDFAISQVIFGKEATLALFIQNLVGAYRVELANLLVILLLLIGSAVFLLFKELNHVFD